MATFFFESITDAQAATYSSATDTLVFLGGGESAKTTTIRFNAATATSGPTISVISGVTGRTVVFGAGLAGEAGTVFPDSSTLYVGTTGADTQAGDALGGGGSTTDGLYGGEGNDSLVGGGAGDVLQGNQGNDTLT